MIVIAPFERESILCWPVGRSDGFILTTRKAAVCRMRIRPAESFRIGCYDVWCDFTGDNRISDSPPEGTRVVITVNDDCSLTCETLSEDNQVRVPSVNQFAFSPGAGQMRPAGARFASSSTCYSYQDIYAQSGNFIDGVELYSKWYWNGSQNTGRSYSGSGINVSTGGYWVSHDSDSDFSSLASPYMWYQGYSYVNNPPHPAYGSHYNSIDNKLYASGYCVANFHVIGYLPTGSQVFHYRGYS